MQPGNTDSNCAAVGRLEGHAATGSKRPVELGDLVALGQIGIEVVLPGEDAGLVHSAPERHGGPGGQPNGFGVGHRQRAWEPEAYWTHVGVGRIAEGGSIATEHLGASTKLDM